MLRYVVGLLLMAGGSLHAAESRFVLEPGLELRYSVRAGTWFDGTDGKPNIPRLPDGSPKYRTSDLTIFVLDRQPEGSYRIVMSSLSEADYPVITWADLFPDGRLKLLPAAMPILEFDSIRTVFPLLPRDEEARRAGWTETDERTGFRLQFRVVETGILAECDSPLDRVSTGRWSIRYQLHPQTRLPDEMVIDGRWDKYKETHSVLIKAKETVRHDRQWVAKFTADATRYFDVMAQNKRSDHQDIVTRAIAEREQPGKAAEILDAGRAKLAAARDALTEPLFRDDIERLIKRGDDFRASRLEAAVKWTKLAGLPSPSWRAVDLDGKEHSLEQYRGRVVVLDFWFRQCSFCIRAMPQVEQAAEVFRREKAPVSFFGASIDKDPTDAQFVADTMKLAYPVLRSEQLAEQLGVTNYPTLLVIGPDGTVQGIFVGYSLTLREDLTDCIRRLVKE